MEIIEINVDESASPDEMQALARLAHEAGYSGELGRYGRKSDGVNMAQSSSARYSEEH